MKHVMANDLDRNMGGNNALESLTLCVATHWRDWSTDKADAWLYGIVCGWDEASKDELQSKYGWTDDEIDRMDMLRADFRERAQWQ